MIQMYRITVKETFDLKHDALYHSCTYPHTRFCLANNEVDHVSTKIILLASQK